MRLRKKTKRLLVLIIILLVSTNFFTFLLSRSQYGANKKNSLPDDHIDLNKPVAVIDNEEIYYPEWMEYLEKQYGEKGLKEMINQKVVTKLAEQEGLEVESEIIDLEVALLSTLAGQLPKERVEQVGEEWRETIEYRLLTERLLTRDIEIQEEEIQSYYNVYQSEYEFVTRVELSHIVVENQATADRVYQELEEGADFAALAREYTIDQDSLINGGYLGFFTEASSFLPAGYFDQASSLDDYQYSQPFQSDQGVVILYLHRHIPEVKLSYEQSREHIRTKLAIEQIEGSPSAKKLWNQLDVDWIY